jgi:DNA-directed RNA polymerase subunit RPC12/RpoP
MFQTKKILHQHMDDNHRTADKRDFLCTYKDCEYRSRQGDGIIHHLMAHYENRVEICPYCQKKFTNHLYYRKHVNDKHKAPTGFTCDLDGAYLKNRKSLIKHMACVHLKFTYYCEICGIPIKFKFNLVQHRLAQHQKETSFKCNYCHLRFVKEESRDLHEEKHIRWGGKRRKND